jgi:hypothetical protein
MIIVWEHVHIGPHVVHHNHEPLEQCIDGLAREMSEVLVLSGMSHTFRDVNRSRKFPYRPTPYLIHPDQIPNWQEKQDQEKN